MSTRIRSLAALGVAVAIGFVVGRVGDNGSAAAQRRFELAFGKRPAEELYDLHADPWQMTNVADEARFAAAKKKLHAELDQYQAATIDPRASGAGIEFDRYFYVTGASTNRPGQRRP